MSHNLYFLPALAILLLSAAPLTPTQSNYLDSLNSSPSIMASPAKQPLMTLSASIQAEVVPTPTPTPITPARAFAGNVATMLRSATAARFGASQVDAMMTLMGKESGLNPYAINKSSGACGIPQAYPCSKLINAIGSLDNVAGQIDWLLSYISNRYGTPSNALNFHYSNGWY